MNHKILFILVFSAVLCGCSGSAHKNYQGYVEGENIYLASPYSGHLVELLVESGQSIKKNQLLFKLDPEPQKFVIAEASAALEQAKQVYDDLKKPKREPEIQAAEAKIEEVAAQISLAQLRVKRYQTLFDKHVTDKDTLDAALERLHELNAVKVQYEANLSFAKLGSRKDQIKAQLSQVAQHTYKVNQAKWELDQKTVYAPADGIIFDTYYKKGEFVEAQRPVAALLAPDNIRIEFFVPSDGLATLHLDKKITFNCEGCAKNNDAVVNFISPEAEYVPPLVYSRENRDKLVFRIKAIIRNASAFKPGQPVVVTVTRDE